MFRNFRNFNIGIVYDLIKCADIMKLRVAEEERQPFSVVNT